MKPTKHDIHRGGTHHERWSKKSVQDRGSELLFNTNIQRRKYLILNYNYLAVVGRTACIYPWVSANLIEVAL